MGKYILRGAKMSKQNFYKRISREILIGMFLLVSCVFGINYVRSEDGYQPLKASTFLGVGEPEVIGQSDTNSNTYGCSSTQLYNPTSVYYDGARLYVVDSVNNRVLIYNNIPTTNGAPADVVVGQEDFDSSSHGCSATKLRNISGVWSDGVKLYIADTINNRVLIYNNIPTTNGASADVVVGQENFDSNTSGCSATQLNYPEGVYSDGNRLYIADSDNNRILIYNTIPTSNGAAADIVIGQIDMDSCSSGCSATQFYGTRSVYSDGENLYLADTGNSRILFYNIIPNTHGAAADVVIGQNNFDIYSSGCSATKFNNPEAVYFDRQRLFIADTNNNRVLIYPLNHNNNSSIEGWIRDSAGNGIDEITVKIQGEYEDSFFPRDFTGSYITDSTGYYKFVYITPVETCTVTPEKEGHFFEPLNRTYSKPLVETHQDFIGTFLSPIKSEVKIQGGEEGYIDVKRGERALIIFNAIDNGIINIKIYTIRGELLQKIVQQVSQGSGIVEWDGKNIEGEMVASGIYVAHIEGPGVKVTKKIAIIN